VRSLLITLEQHLGRFAIPGLVRIILTLQAVVWILMQLGDGGKGLLTSLMFYPPAMTINNEWWRLLSFLVMPSGDGVMWLVFGVSFMWMISDGVEEAWGSFRVNLFMLACVICVVAEGFWHMNFAINSFYMLSSLVMAYAVYYPDQVINFALVIPLKMKWIGLIDFGYVVFNWMRAGEAESWHIIASMIPFFAVFGPGFYQLTHRTVKTMERRHRYVSALRPDSESLHRCSRCGKTENEHPQLDFRVNAEGEDVCSECRAAAKAQG